MIILYFNIDTFHNVTKTKLNSVALELKSNEFIFVVLHDLRSSWYNLFHINIFFCSITASY